MIHLLLDNTLLTSNVSLVKSDHILELDLKTLPFENRIQRLRIIASDNNKPGNVISCWIKNGRILPSNDNGL
jgi:hypothetical protein